MAGTEPDKVSAECAKFLTRARNIAADGFLVYDIQDEAGRTTMERPFPFRKMMDCSAYGQVLNKMSGKESILYKCVAEADPGGFAGWMDTATGPHEHQCFNLVGGATSSREYSGPTMDDAAAMLAKKKTTAFGCVTIAERHTKKGTEHELLAKKVKLGAEWFISQAIYDPTAMSKLINDYGALCKEQGTKPKKIVLTFAPCGKPKTALFIEWLGVNMPEDIKTQILESANPAQTSVDLLCGMCRSILQDCASSGVPLGISVESVSIFKVEVEASFDMFNKLQVMLLDNHGVPYALKWQTLDEESKKSKPSLAEMALPLVAGLALGFLARPALAKA
eukprot:CAMPEP_0170142796 /NCGR_PEP_ID=MMETSP0033_2-20121228/8556_1 /TAXON_ID=195969 /ORGANISM="Dolichomastix tenuilepis, Strain CCMP3274" /LENGTH=334 /DNA_ID=CAMNT_0010379171 /DNA_START=81 /DNA_END=1085 /DNA_ORIENTATION=+